jgi:cyclopropane fatty-acyl-phospholipid synthase-like methyltransferase
MTRSFILLILLIAAGCASSEPNAHQDAMHHPRSPNAHHHDFSGAEEWSRRFDSPERDAWQKPEAVIAAMSLSEGMRVADIGAGTGYFLPHLSRAVGEQGRVWGLDVEPDMVRFMKDRATREGLSNTDARQIPTDAPGVEAASLDRVLIVNTWHHIGERVAYANKLRATLAPGGQLIIVEYTADAEPGPPPAMRLSPQTVIDELTQGGFDAALADQDLPRQYIIVATRR